MRRGFRNEYEDGSGWSLPEYKEAGWVVSLFLEHATGEEIAGQILALFKGDAVVAHAPPVWPSGEY